MNINNGLQLHLPLNEIVENAAKEKEVVDISGNKFNGKVHGATVVVDSRFGNCINFDGVDDYIELPTTTIPQTGEITISFWANGGNSLPKGTTILWAVNQYNHYMVNIHLPWGNSVIHFDCGNTTTSDNSGDRISKLANALDFKDKWTYWTFTKNVTTGEMNIYLNGSLWHNGTGKNKPITSITQVKFGASDVFYDGKVAHLRIYDRALSPEEINECMKVDGTPPPMDINSGLQLHLPLNEIVENAESEKEVVDVSAGKLNGKVYGATVVAEPRFGNCLSFDGVDDYIQMPEMNIDYSKGITVEAWVYYNSFKHQSRVIDFANGPRKNNIIFGNHNTTNDGLLVVFVGSTRKAIEVKGILEASKWLHLTVTIDESGNAKVYKNGQEVGGGLVAVPNSVNRTKNYIGVSNWSGIGYFHGKMTNLRIYDRVLSPEEINECMKVDGTPPAMDINNGLQLHLPLNEIVENAAKEKEVVDISAGKLNGKVHGATVVAEPRFGNCLNFNGNNDYVIINPMPNFPSEVITVYCWIKSNNTVKAGTPFSYANSQTDNAFILYDIRKLLFFINCGPTDAKKTEVAFNDGIWHCLAVSWNSSNGQLKVYQDGEEKYSGTFSQGKKITSGGSLVLGQEQDQVAGGFHVNQAFEGQMAHVRMYNRVLSPEEINECMKVDTAPPPMDINSGLQLHLPLNEIVENAAKEKEVVDISAGKLNGKVHGATVVAEPRFGNCLNFNGNNDYVIINPMPNFPSEAMTVLCWVRSNNQQKEGTVVSYAKSSAQKYNEFQIYNIKNITPTVNNKWYSTGVAVNDGEWHCVAITWQSSDGQFKVYKDGKEVHSKVISQGTPIATGGALVLAQEQDKLGAGFAANQAFQGQMAHLRMYNRVLSPEDINECMEVDGTPPPIDINRGLQFHLPLNEIVENSAKEKEVVDVSPAKLKGKVNGNPKILDDPRFGNCLNFDGVDNYIQMPEMNIDYSQGLTVEAWVHYNSFKNWSRIIDFGNGTPNNNIVFANETTTSNLCFDSFKGTTSNRVQANGKLELSKWLHLAVTVDGSGNTKIYNNGTEVGSGSINLPNKINRTKNYIGKSNWPDELFYGKMSNLRLYNRALSKEEINECMEVDQNPPPMDINRGLQLHLPLNEIVENAESEKEVVDISAAKLNGKVNGNPTVADDSKLGSCLNFDGVDDYIQMPEMNVDYSQGLTVGAWVHYNSFKKWSRIIDFGNGAPNDNILFANELTTNNLAFQVNKGTTQNRVKADGKLELNQWVYVTVTVDGSGSSKIYKNGEEVQSGLVHLPNNLNRTKNYIGKSNWSTDGYFHGKMSHLRMYNRALSPEEINECMKVDGTPRLQLHLPLNEIVENSAKEPEVVDVSPGKLNGTVHGATVVADDRFGNCINFDGVDDYIELPTATIPQTGEITISFWANGGKSLPKYNSIIVAYNQSNHRVVNVHLAWSDSKIYFDCGNTTTADDSFDRIDKLAQAVDFKDKWTHWTFTKNVATGEMKIYQNGSLWHSGTGKDKPIGSVAMVRFGCDPGTLFYHGKVAHLRIYDRVLSPEEINELMQVDAADATDATSTTGEGDGTQTTDATDATLTSGESDTEATSTTGEGDTTDTTSTEETDTSSTTDATDTTSTTGEGDGTATTETTDTTSTTGEDDGTATTETTDTTSATGEDDGTATTETTDATSTTGEGDGAATTETTGTTSTTGEGDGAATTETTDTTSTTGEGETETSSTTDATDTTQKPMEYQIYQVKGNPTIKTGYSASEWTAVIAGFNCGAKQKHKATALQIMPVVDDGEWKIKCDIKDADDRYWDVAVLFIRNNMVNRLNNFYR